MAESSFLWTTGGAGDGAATYTRSNWSDILKIVAACLDEEGVALGYLNALVGSVPAANTARIGTGGALVDGKPYLNSAAVDVNIPSAVGGGNTRIDRVVLRANWTAQTVRITRIAGVDAASPAAPAITQTPGTTYDIMLYQALVTTGGVVTLTDERVLAVPGTDSIFTAALRALVVTTAKLALNAVGFAQMVASAAAGLSVIGRSANSAGNFAEIVFGADGDVLRRSGTTLAAGKLIGDINVTAGGLTNASLANRARAFAAPVTATENQTDGAHMIGGASGAVMLDAKFYRVTGTFHVPLDYVSGMTVSAVLFAAFSGNVYCQMSARGGVMGANFTKDINIGGAFGAVAFTANQLKKVITLDLSAAGIAAGDVVAVHFQRDAVSASDTVNGTMIFEEFLVEYTADM